MSLAGIGAQDQFGLLWLPRLNLQRLSQMHFKELMLLFSFKAPS
jgi:hypothetical protein